jgi:hypothetical protein
MAQRVADDDDSEELTAKDYVDIASYMNAMYHGHARSNVQKWGLQSVGVLLCATMEELGEMAMEMRSSMEIESEDEIDEYSMYALIDDMADFGERVQQVHEEIYEDSEGNPIDGPEIRYTGDTGRFQSELTDTVALMYQLQAALDRQSMEVAEDE